MMMSNLTFISSGRVHVDFTTQIVARVKPAEVLADCYDVMMKMHNNVIRDNHLQHTSMQHTSTGFVASCACCCILCTLFQMPQ